MMKKNQVLIIILILIICTSYIQVNPPITYLSISINIKGKPLFHKCSLERKNIDTTTCLTLVLDTIVSEFPPKNLFNQYLINIDSIMKPIKIILSQFTVTMPLPTNDYWHVHHDNCFDKSDLNRMNHCSSLWLEDIRLKYINYKADTAVINYWPMMIYIKN